MLKDFFNFKRAKTPTEALVFYGVAVMAYFVLAAVGEAFFMNGGM